MTKVDGIRQSDLQYTPPCPGRTGLFDAAQRPLAALRRVETPRCDPPIIGLLSRRRLA
jgi:hypothetical protein